MRIVTSNLQKFIAADVQQTAILLCSAELDVA